MPVAYVLVNVEMGAEPEILKKLRKLPNVKEAHSVYGLYDLIVKVEFESLSGLKDYIYKHIRNLDKVRSTLTMIVSD
ncbi:MAG: Lrp/AsnC family transcriptional regulator [Candidatus Hecatellales archaeon]|nr:MAG: Lrp/AsnC family transcriptional regulator [Candidatus Hecatellales archaeon]